MTQDEILEMVREAGGSDVGGPGWTTWVGTQSTEFLERFAKFVAAKTLAQTQEPVAVVSGYYGGQCVILPIDPARIFNSNTALYTTPPQRTWVGLTDEDKHEIELRAGITEDDDGYIVSQVFKLIEAKLKEKNT